MFIGSATSVATRMLSLVSIVNTSSITMLMVVISITAATAAATQQSNNNSKSSKKTNINKGRDSEEQRQPQH